MNPKGDSMTVKKRIIIVAMVVATLVLSLPLSTSAYTGQFNGTNGVYGSYYTSDGVAISNFRSTIYSSGNNTGGRFTGTITLSIPSAIKAGGKVYYGDSISFYNSYNSIFQNVKDENLGSGTSTIKSTIVNEGNNFNIKIVSSNYYYQDHGYWTTWFTSLVVDNSYGGAFGTTPAEGMGGSWDNAFKVVVRVDITLEALLEALGGISGDLDDIKQQLKDNDQTVQELLEEQKKTNDKLDDVNDALKPPGTDTAGGSVNDAVSNAGDVLGELSGADKDAADGITNIMGFWAESEGFGRTDQLLRYLYNSCTFTLWWGTSDINGGHSIEINVLAVFGWLLLLSIIGAIFYKFLPKE